MAVFPCAVEDASDAAASVALAAWTICRRDNEGLSCCAMMLSTVLRFQRGKKGIVAKTRRTPAVPAPVRHIYFDCPTLGALPSSWAMSRWCFSAGSVLPAQSFSAELSPPLE